MSRPIVIVGGGFGGAYVARYLERELPRDCEIILFSGKTSDLHADAGPGRRQPLSRF